MRALNTPFWGLVPDPSAHTSPPHSAAPPPGWPSQGWASGQQGDPHALSLSRPPSPSHSLALPTPLEPDSLHSHGPSSGLLSAPGASPWPPASSLQSFLELPPPPSQSPSHSKPWHSGLPARSPPLTSNFLATPPHSLPQGLCIFCSLRWDLPPSTPPQHPPKKSLLISISPPPSPKPPPWLPSAQGDGFQNIFKTRRPTAKRNLTPKQNHILRRDLEI